MAGIDTTKAHPARMYDFLLGGKDHFEADRAAISSLLQAVPTARTGARENRRFLGRAVRYLVQEAGIRQFLDIGTGLPTVGNVHEVAQAIAPQTRVVYVDNDPIVLAHARALLTSHPAGRTAYIEADLHDPEAIVGDPVVRETLDFSQPVALMMLAILHFFPDGDDPAGIVARLVRELAPGSAVVASQTTADFNDPAAAADGVQAVHQAGLAFQTRSAEDFASVAFPGLKLVPPGIVAVSEWRPEGDDLRPLPPEVGYLGGIGLKPLPPEVPMDIDLGAVRTFLAVVDDGRFTDAADRLDLTQQAVSKRIARLEADLGVQLIVRSRTGARPTGDGAAFLPQARALISLADQATAMLRARRRALRVDALAPDAAPLDLVRAFYEASDAEVDIAVSRGSLSWETALGDGSLDAAFGRVRGPLPPGIKRAPAWLEPMFALVGRRHKFARRQRVPVAELSGLTAWMPNNARDSEWAEYYRFFSAEFGVGIDTSGPVFGREHIVERIGGSPDLMMFVARTQFAGHPGVVHVPVTDPGPVYPWSLMWHEANRHPALPPLIAHVKGRYRTYDPSRQWLPVPDRDLFPSKGR